jgi:hypothetical protein
MMMMPPVVVMMPPGFLDERSAGCLHYSARALMSGDWHGTALRR